MRDFKKLTKVNLGCGGDITPEYLNVDIRSDTLADVIADVRNLPFADERFDEVFSCDCLEHISHRETHATITEWVRILKKGGKMKLILPNIMHAFYLLQDECQGEGIVDYGAVINILYGAQDYNLNIHMMGFTPAYIKILLDQHGIKVESIEEKGMHIIVEGIKR